MPDDPMSADLAALSALRHEINALRDELSMLFPPVTVREFVPDAETRQRCAAVRQDCAAVREACADQQQRCAAQQAKLAAAMEAQRDLLRQAGTGTAGPRRRSKGSAS